MTRLVVSVAALVISIIAILSSAAQWLLSGPWVTMQNVTATIMGQPAHPLCMVLTVHNSGRGTTWVQQWGWVIKGTLYGPTGWTNGPALPHKLEGGAEARWMMDYNEAQQNLVQNYKRPQHYWDLVPFVRLGSGKRFRYGGSSTILRIWEPGAVVGQNPIFARWPVRFLIRYSPFHEPSQTRHGTGWQKKQRRW